jgi:hypothetical protein
MEITQKIAQKVLDTVNAGLVAGIGEPIPGKMCVEAAVCFAMGLPHGDSPPCVSPALLGLKISLNDAGWSSNLARTNGLRELALLQLGTDGVLDEVEFAKRLSLLVINNYLPPMLRKIHLNQEADVCEQAKDLDTARAASDVVFDAINNAAYVSGRNTANAAAANAADAAARAAHYARYANAADAAAWAVRVVRNLPSGDKTLLSFAKDVAAILIDMKVPGIQWLNLLNNNNH